MSNVISDMRCDLRENADEDTCLSGPRFFKEPVQLYGVKTAVVHRLAKRHFRTLPDKDKQEVFALCELLWQSGYLEEGFIACDWSYYVKNDYEERDLHRFERWVGQYVTNWATCDTLCNHTVGTLLEMYPAAVAKLQRWAHAENRWLRRGAAVSLIIPARKGLFRDDIFEIADLLLTDQDDLVQKGYGWMLKVTSQAHPDAVYRYVVARKDRMPRTALGYAVEKLPPELRKAAMTR